MTLSKSAFKIVACTLMLSTLFSCKKEKSWSSSVQEVNDIGYYEATVAAEFELPRNDNYVYVGVCWATTANPTAELGFKREKQLLESDRVLFFFDGLTPNQTYYVRSYIQTKKGDIIYSDDYTFETTAATSAPCFTESGKIDFNASTYVMADLYESTPDGNYQLSTSCSFGELDFTFAEKPVPNVYRAISSESDLGGNAVVIDGILGIGWTCYHKASLDQEIFVEVLEDETISITFCDLLMLPTGSCEDDQILFGEVHQ